MSYWASRAQKENRKLYDSTLSEFEKELAAYYRVAAKDIKADILFLYADILASMESGEQLTMNQLYRYDRFVKLQKKINAILTDLGEKEIALSSKKYETMGKYCSARIAKEAEKAGFLQSSFVVLDDKRVKELVSSVWCNDGKHWSSRIWDNQSMLQKSIEKGLIDSVARGAPKDQLVKALQNQMGVGFSQADRIARTELAYIQNKSTAETYKKAGIAEVETIVADDERLCDVCGKHSGEVHSIVDAKPGKAFLFHPNCRCDILPIV